MKANNIILVACAAFAAGIWLATVQSWQLTTLAGLAVILLITTVWRVYSNCQRSLGPVAALFFIVGMLCYNQAALIRSDDISRYAEQTVTITGTIDAVPEITAVDENNKRVRYIIKTEKIKLANSGSNVSVSGKIRLSIQYTNAEAKLAAFGDRVTCYGKVLELHGYNNPGQIDMTASPKRQGITARMVGQEQTIKILAVNNDYSWQVGLANWRQTMIAGLQQVMPINDAAIMTAVLFGGYQGIDKNVISNFAATGLIHILSVSGAHIALVIGLITWIGNRLRWSTFFTIALAAILIFFYAVMSGLTPPVIRSAIMGIIALLAVVLDRDTYAPTALGITGLAMLIYQPLLLFDISFQLSFGATAGLIFLYQKTLTSMSKWPAWLAGPIAVTLAAQLGVLPVIAWYFNNFSLISFVANIVVLPVIEMVIILGLAGVILYSAIPVVGSIIFVISSLLVGVVIVFTELLTAVPYSSVYIPSVGISASTMYYLGLAWVYGWRPLQLPGTGQLIAKWPSSWYFAVILVIIFFTGYAWYPQPLTVHFIDVGQGDATLIITPQGKAVLVDTGGTMGDSGFDIGERVVAPYLKHYGIRSLDYLILTHGHQDHAGGAAGVAGVIKIVNVLLPQEEHSPSVQAMLHTLRKTVVIPVYTGLSFQIDNVMFRIEQAEGKQQNNQKSINNNEGSSVIRVKYGLHSFLLTGDLAAQGEAALLKNNIAPCTVLKVGHHGARTSTTASFLQAVSPQYAVISAGYGNKFGHPHLETLARLEKQETVVFRTDLQGAVVFTSNGKQITVDTYIK